MLKVIKTKGKNIKAYRLGDNNTVIEDLIKEGKIRVRKNGKYEIFSQESVNGAGQTALAGDYIKIDESGYPYPNSREFFLKNHRHIEGDIYEQLPSPLQAWNVGEPMCPEVEFLVKSKRLTICPETPEKYFNAFLWGADLSAAKDAVLIFYSIQKDNDGNIVDADFSFVAKTQFEKTYKIIDRN